MKRLLIVTLVLVCLALTQGKVLAEAIEGDMPECVSMTDGGADPNEGGGNE
jgi:hypothetical protein